MSLLIFTATLLGGVVLGALITAATFWIAAVKEFAGAVEEHVAPVLASHTKEK